MARYLVGLLYERKFFETVEPVNFTTFASPAIGSRSCFNQKTHNLLLILCLLFFLVPRYDSFWSVVIRYLGARTFFEYNITLSAESCLLSLQDY